MVGSKHILSGILGAGLLLGGAQGAMATLFTGTLFYTKFDGGVNVNDVTYSYDDVGHVFLTGPIVGVASTPGADGIIFAPNGNLLIGGQGSGKVYEVDPTTGVIVGSAAPGTTGGNQNSFH